MRVQPQAPANLAAHPWGYVFPALSLCGLLTVLVGGHVGRDRLAFLGSCAYLVGMLTSAAFGVFPYVLPARPDAGLSLTIHNAATSPYGLAMGLLWWIPGMLLALGYMVFTYRHFAGKVRPEGEGY
jgi:cytochrome d ubiquinol oxidase subunit II